MKPTRIAAAACSVLLASIARGELTYAVSPPVAPQGMPIVVSVTNETDAPESMVLGFGVVDAAGNTILSHFAMGIGANLEHGEAWYSTWDQTDDDGEQVPAGNYFVVPATSLHGEGMLVQVDESADAALAMVGLPMTGTTRELHISAPVHPLSNYLVLASLGPGGIPTCGGTLPLSADPLLQISMNLDSGLFEGQLGLLDDEGSSKSSKLIIPDQAGLVGLELHIAALVLAAPSASCPILAASKALPVAIGS